MSNKPINLILLTGLILVMAACSPSKPAATPTTAPPPAEVDEADAPAEAEDEGSQGDAADAEEEGEEESSAPAIDAAAIFGARCAGCHGADRVSGSAPDLVPDHLTAGREAYVSIITDGSGPMPAWGSRLSAEEIDALVDFILSQPE